ncbi:hypothetical protein [Sorangium sp. So ce131]|uniref:hypothetical protein n=1 Tax=Sorangium sp. So ce131 TaxID=3133282 RepID=UPI003F60FC00
MKRRTVLGAKRLVDLAQQEGLLRGREARAVSRLAEVAARAVALDVYLLAVANGRAQLKDAAIRVLVRD